MALSAGGTAAGRGLEPFRCGRSGRTRPLGGGETRQVRLTTREQAHGLDRVDVVVARRGWRNTDFREELPTGTGSKAANHELLWLKADSSLPLLSDPHPESGSGACSQRGLPEKAQGRRRKDVAERNQRSGIGVSRVDQAHAVRRRDEARH